VIPQNTQLSIPTLVTRHRNYYGISLCFGKSRSGGGLKPQTTAFGLSIIKSYKISNQKEIPNTGKQQEKDIHSSIQDIPQQSGPKL